MESKKTGREEDLWAHEEPASFLWRILMVERR